MTPASLVTMTITILGACLTLLGLVWKLSSLTTSFQLTMRQLTDDVATVKPRLAELDRLPLLGRDIAEVKETTSALDARLAKHDSHITHLLERTAVAEALRASQGGYDR